MRGGQGSQRRGAQARERVRCSGQQVSLEALAPADPPPTALPTLPTSEALKLSLVGGDHRQAAQQLGWQRVGGAAGIQHHRHACCVRQLRRRVWDEARLRPWQVVAAAAAAAAEREAGPHASALIAFKEVEEGAVVLAPLAAVAAEFRVPSGSLVALVLHAVLLLGPAL